MTSFSCCMIVKNEEKLLDRCLSSIADLMDEIIIVDTGSTDATKQVAARYTDKIYDFAWDDDFSAARNYSFSLATGDYIYCPDADEYLDAANHEQLRLLKQYIDPQVDIVQMMYNTISENTVLNIRNEYRPKLFKRLRTFTWVDPIHETVRLEPLVFNSDISITHAPIDNHAKRDFRIFQKSIAKYGSLSTNVTVMYATELLKQGSLEDLQQAHDYFQQLFECAQDEYIKIVAGCVLVRLARTANDRKAMMALLPEYPAAKTTSEICYDFGIYYMNLGEYTKAIDWLHVAINDVSYCLDVHCGGDYALEALCSCYKRLIKLGASAEKIEIYKSELSVYEKMLKDWHLPEEQNM